MRCCRNVEGRARAAAAALCLKTGAPPRAFDAKLLVKRLKEQKAYLV